ncbi:hypothetical protein [Paucibacter sp. Y2R2-4]|uniref:hypothetical protein n=1 Tax=Paucibacter sp. Y2R2-4 TaxID=2893553 RepID=UPI00296245B8|nr:hypothetical protein [Paucibacter sp. Y2R2-4]
MQLLLLLKPLRPLPALLTLLPQLLLPLLLPALLTLLRLSALPLLTLLPQSASNQTSF